MWVNILVIYISLCRSQEILIHKNTDFIVCIQRIILDNFEKGSEITYVDLNYPDNDVIKNIHNLKTVKIVSRTSKKRINQHNEAYVIMTNNFDTFNDKFENITKEKDWNPNVYFLIVFKEFDTKFLTKLFNILLNYHVFDAVVIDSTEIQLFTYNPFDNYNCGKCYTNIIKFGNCVQNVSLYFYKYKTGLRNCTFNAVVSHWPPYVINPNIDFGPVKLLGTEQYVMKILSELEGFHVNYTFRDNGEEFSIIDNDMEASGPLSLIQNEHTDMIFGGMLLTYERAEAFSYFCGHHAFTDKLNIIVKKTGPVPLWTNLYLEFKYIVWILLILTFVTFFAILIISFCIKEKCKIILIMWAILFQQGCRLSFKFKVKCFIFQWVIFASLINMYYQSILVGLTTHVSHNYQVSNEKDLIDFKLESCVSPVIKEVVRITTGKVYNEFDKYCDTVLNSLDAVSEDSNKYTVTLYSIFNYNRLKYTNEFGEPLLYAFKIPIYKIMYAVYFYKGFPMLQKLHTHTLRLRENGLINKEMDDLFYENARKTFFAKKQFQARFIFPYCILIIGLGFSLMSFVVEVIVNYVQRKRMNRVIFLH